MRVLVQNWVVWIAELDKPHLVEETAESIRYNLTREGYDVTRIYWQTVRGYFASGYLYDPATDRVRKFENTAGSYSSPQD